MTTSSWDRSRRLATAAAMLTATVIAVTAVLLVRSVGAGVPDEWWPRTGQAFAASTPTAHHDRCSLIVGPANSYCESGGTSTAAGRQGMAGAVWTLVPVGAGAAVLLVWRLRHAVRARRR